MLKSNEEISEIEKTYLAKALLIILACIRHHSCEWNLQFPKWLIKAVFTCTYTASFLCEFGHVACNLLFLQCLPVYGFSDV